MSRTLKITVGSLIRVGVSSPELLTKPIRIVRDIFILMTVLAKLSEWYFDKILDFKSAL